MFAESRPVHPTVLRLYFEAGRQPDLKRVDLRLIGRDRVAVQVRLEIAGEGPAAARVRCADVTVPRGVANRRLVSDDGSRLEPGGYGVEPGAAAPGGCTAVDGNVVKKFEPLDEG